MGYKEFSLKTIISIGEIWPNKKNHTEHKYSVIFESRNKNKFETWLESWKGRFYDLHRFESLRLNWTFGRAWSICSELKHLSCILFRCYFTLSTFLELYFHRGANLIIIGFEFNAIYAQNLDRVGILPSGTENVHNLCFWGHLAQFWLVSR